MKQSSNVLLIFLLLTALLVLPGCGGSAAHDPQQAAAADDSSTAAPETESNATELPEEAPEPESESGPEEIPAEPVETPAWQWQYGSPVDYGVDGTVLESLHNSYAANGIHSALVYKSGTIVEAYYGDGYDESSTFALNSASKSVTSALVGIAIDQGILPGVETPLSVYFPELLTFSDPRWQDVTLWHLLTHTSGIAFTDDENWYDWRASPDWLGYLLEQPIRSAPGTVFAYSTGNTHLLAAVLERATGQSLLEFGRDTLFDRIGMDSVACATDPQGVSDGGNGFSMTSLDLLKFGLLYLNGGVWEGEQILPASWIADSTRFQVDRPGGTADYGYQWWVRTFGAAAHPAYFAQGHAGQYLFVIPALELIVVFTSDYSGSSSLYWQYVEEIVAACDG